MKNHDVTVKVSIFRTYSILADDQGEAESIAFEIANKEYADDQKNADAPILINIVEEGDE